MNPERYLTYKDLASMLQQSRRNIYRKQAAWRADGLKSFNIGGAVRFRESDVHAWMDKKNKVSL